MLFFSYHQHSDVKEYIFQVLRPSILGDFFFLLFYASRRGTKPNNLATGIQCAYASQNSDQSVCSETRFPPFQIDLSCEISCSSTNTIDNEWLHTLQTP